MSIACQRPQLWWIVLLQSVDQLGVRGPGHQLSFEVLSKGL